MERCMLKVGELVYICTYNLLTRERINVGVGHVTSCGKSASDYYTVTGVDGNIYHGTNFRINEYTTYFFYSTQQLIDELNRDIEKQNQIIAEANKRKTADKELLDKLSSQLSSEIVASKERHRLV